MTGCTLKLLYPASGCSQNLPCWYTSRQFPGQYKRCIQAMENTTPPTSLLSMLHPSHYAKWLVKKKKNRTAGVIARTGLEKLEGNSGRPLKYPSIGTDGKWCIQRKGEGQMTGTLIYNIRKNHAEMTQYPIIATL